MPGTDCERGVMVATLGNTSVFLLTRSRKCFYFLYDNDADDRAISLVFNLE